METFEKIRKYLEKNDFRCVGRKEAKEEIYMSDDNKIMVTIKFNMDKMTAEDEERVKQRLIELGYL
jgi:hypothetical protein